MHDVQKVDYYKYRCISQPRCSGSPFVLLTKFEFKTIYYYNIFPVNVQKLLLKKFCYTGEAQISNAVHDVVQFNGSLR